MFQWREVSFIFGSGSVGHCKSNGECKIAYPKGSFPNGVVKGHDGLYYVSQTTSSRITVLSLQDDGTLLKVDEIVVGMGVDNLSIDDNGDIFGYVETSIFKLVVCQKMHVRLEFLNTDSCIV